MSGNPYDALPLETLTAPKGVPAEPPKDTALQAPPAANPYDQMFAQMDDQDAFDKRVRFHQSMNAARAMDPDRAGQAREIADKTLMPLDMAYDHMDDVLATFTRDGVDYEELRRSSPTTTAWLSNANNAAVAHDSVNTLTELEQIFAAMGTPGGLGGYALDTGLVKGFKQGMSSLEYSYRTAIGLGGGVESTIGRGLLESDLPPSFKMWAQYGLDQIGLGSDVQNEERIKQLRAAQGEPLDESNPFKFVSVETGRMAPTVLSMLGGEIAASALGPLAPVATKAFPGVYGYVTSVGPAYYALKDSVDANGRKMPDAYARAGAIAQGAFTGALFMVTFPQIKKLFSAGVVDDAANAALKDMLERPLFRRALQARAKQFGSATTFQALQMAGMTAADAVVQWATKELTGQPFEHPEAKTVIQDIFHSVLVGLAGGAGIGGAGLVGWSIPRDYFDASRSAQRQEQVRKIGEKIAASKLASRTSGREALGNFAGVASENGQAPASVYVPVSRFTTLFQTVGTDPAVAAQELGVTSEYAEAVKHGGDVAIPFPKYVEKIAGTKLEAAMLQDVRLNPGDMTPRMKAEWDAAQKQIPAETKKILDEISEGKKSAGQGVFDQRMQQLLDVGYDRATAEHDARIHQAFFRVYGEKMNVAPEELARQFPLEIVRGGIPTHGTVLEQARAEVVKPMPVGECFKNAVKFAASAEEGAVVVHGQVTNVEGKRISHAWVEQGNTVTDPTTGVQMPKTQYYSLLNAQVDHTYDATDAMVRAVREGHWGPWEEPKTVLYQTYNGPNKSRWEAGDHSPELMATVPGEPAWHLDFDENAEGDTMLAASKAAITKEEGDGGASVPKPYVVLDKSYDAVGRFESLDEAQRFAEDWADGRVEGRKSEDEIITESLDSVKTTLQSIPLPAEAKGWVERTVKRLARNKSKDEAVGLPRNARTKLKMADGNVFVVGKISPKDWVDRWEALLTPEQWSEYSKWYDDVRRQFISRFGTEQGPNYMIAWLMSNQNVSPGVAQLNALRAREQLAAPSEESSKRGGLSHDAVTEFWKAVAGLPHNLKGLGGPKLYDFVDSGLGSLTRTWAGHDKRAGKPVVVDIWSTRDVGFVSDIFKRMLAPLLANDAERAKLEALETDIATSTTGSDTSPSEPQYEHGVQFLQKAHAIAVKRGLLPADSTPSAAQAVGWMGLVNLTGSKFGGTAESAILNRMHTFSTEAMPGEGSPLEAALAPLKGLPLEDQVRATAEVTKARMAAAMKIVGAGVVSRAVSRFGGWFNPETGRVETNPAVAFDVPVTDERAPALAAALGYIGHQSEQWDVRYGAKQSKDRTFAGVEFTHPSFADAETVSKFWGELAKIDPDLASGFMPTEIDGVPAILSLRGGEDMKGFAPAKLEAEIARLDGIVGEAVTRAAVAAGLDGEITVSYTSRAVDIQRGKWGNGHAGEDYLARVEATLGSRARQALVDDAAAVNADVTRIVNDAVLQHASAGLAAAGAADAAPATPAAGIAGVPQAGRGVAETAVSGASGFGPEFSGKPQREGAASANLIRYTTRPDRTEIDPANAGLGSAGSERRRFGLGNFGKQGGVAARIYAYVRDGAELPPPEKTLAGKNAQQFVATNLYDTRTDPLGFLKDAGANIDKLEEAISAAGFDGRISAPAPGMESPYAVLFDLPPGTKIPVEPVTTTLHQDDNSTPLGSISFSDPRSGFKITLSEKENLSTFLHETGHYFMEILGSLAAEVDAPQAIKSDFEVLLKHFGVKDASGITREHREEFARSFESYLREGKAPSAELVPAFARFRAWLTTVYKKASSLGVVLDPEVRGVMQRMLASDTEIAAVEEQQSYARMFKTTPEDLGGLIDASVVASSAERAAYGEASAAAEQEARTELFDVLQEQVRRETTDWWNEEKAKTTEKVTAEFNEMPSYRAASFLRTGKMVDGSEVPVSLKDAEGNPLKIDAAEVDKAYGPEARSLYRLLGVKKGQAGTDPGHIAEQLGFVTGKEMMDSIIADRPSKLKITDEVQRRMLAEHGDILNDGTIQDRAVEIVHRVEERQRQLVTEHAWLLKLAKQNEGVVAREEKAEAKEQSKADKQAAREQKSLEESYARDERNRALMEGSKENAAEKRIFFEAMRLEARASLGEKRFRDTQPAVYKNAEAKAAKQVMVAIEKGDYYAAAGAQRARLAAFAHYLEAIAAQKESLSAADYLNRSNKEPQRAKLNQAGFDYLAQQDSLLRRFDFRPSLSLATDAKRQSLLDWATNEVAEGRDPVVHPKMLDEAYRTSWKNLTHDEIIGLRDTVKNIRKMASLKNGLLDNADKRLFKAQTEQLNAQMAKLSKKPGRPISSSSETWSQRSRRAFAEARTTFRKMEEVVDMIDDKDRHGIAHQLLFNKLDLAEKNEFLLRDKIGEKVEKYFEAMPKEIRESLDKPEFIPEIGRSMTRREILTMALNMGNTENQQRLTDHKRSDFKTWGPDVVEKIVKRLTVHEWDFAQGMWDTLKTLWPMIQAQQERLTGLAPKAVVIQSFMRTFEDGSSKRYEGGYYPLVYDRVESPTIETQMDPVIAALTGGQYQRAVTPHGWVNNRVTDFKAPLSLDFGVLPRHIVAVIHDLTHREAILDVRKVIMDPSVKAMMIERIGEPQYNKFMPWLQYLAQNKTPPVLEGDRWLGHYLRTSRSNMVAAYCGLSTAVPLVHATGFFQALEFVRPMSLLTATKDVFTEPFDMPDWIREQSPGMMGHFMEVSDRDVSEVFQQIRNQKGIVPATQRFAMVMFTMMRKGLSNIVFLAKYREALELDHTHEQAVLEAEAAVRKVMASGSPKDLAPIQRGNQALKLFTAFYTWESAMYNRVDTYATDIAKAARNKDASKIPSLIARSFAVVIAPALLSELLRGRTPEKDESWAHWAIMHTLLFPTSLVPFGRDLGKALLTGRDVEFAPIVRSVNDFVKATKEIPEAWEGKKDPVEAGLDLFGSLGAVTVPLVPELNPLSGLPTAAVARRAQYLWDLYNGRENPQTAWEKIHLIWGPKSKHMK